MSRAMKEAGYDFIVTGVARNNLQSRCAHEKVGFRPLQPSDDDNNEAHEDQDGDYQNIVLRLR